MPSAVSRLLMRLAGSQFTVSSASACRLVSLLPTPLEAVVQKGMIVLPDTSTLSRKV